ncbi:MAG: 7TM diverse intracellular signaling domain-containing protein [Pseudoxanthomonas sp.]
MWLWFAMLVGLLAGCAPMPAGTQDVRDAPREIVRAEAVRSDWSSQVPPAAGWTPVALMDVWDARWPAHDGVVWYRVRWHQEAADTPIGLMVGYACLANAVYVNGSLLARDPQLVEPLSRSWFLPQYFVLSAPVLKPGENTLLVRVSGLSAYQPGFGPVVLGDPLQVKALHAREMFQRHHIRLINFAMAAVLGVIFLLVWLLRRQDEVFGWFALTELAGSLYAYNYIAPSPWPFATTDGWQAMNAALYLAAGWSYAIFLLRFGERRLPRIERALGGVCVLAFALALIAPHWMGPHRMAWYVLGGATYYLALGWFMWRAWKTPRVDYRVLAACLVIPVLASFHDFALFFGWVRGDTYLLALTSVPSLIGIAFTLAHRFVAAMKRAESFNVELQREVSQATRQLEETLEREHALALDNSRTGERLRLTRDLHDGFGGTLVAAIARLEQRPGEASAGEIVDELKRMRDDLRLILDSTTRERADVVGLLAPLRHRSGDWLESAGIESHWVLEDVEGVELEGARSLDLLRLVQEALTNVFKHSRATRAEVRLRRLDGYLHLSILDNGQGMSHRAGDAARSGAGLASLRQRAVRLGGELELDSSGGGTQLRVAFPLG